MIRLNWSWQPPTAWQIQVAYVLNLDLVNLWKKEQKN